MIETIFRRVFTAQVAGGFLLVGAAQTLVYGITSVLSDANSKVLAYASLIAVLIGLVLGTKKSKPFQTSAWIAAIGIVGVWILGARLTDALIDLIRQIDLLIPQIIPAIRFDTHINIEGVRVAWSVISEASHALSLRFQTWIIGIELGVKVDDALIRNMFWLYAIWLIEVWMGWFAAQRNAILAMTPAVAVLTSISSYNESHVEALWLLVVIMLLLMGLWNYKNHIHEWATGKVDYSESITYDSGMAVLSLAIMIGGLAFLTPSISWHELQNRWRALHEANDQVAETFGIQKQPGSPIAPRVEVPTLPRQHLLSGEVAKSEKVVMTIRTGELPPISGPNPSILVPHHYWRSVIYDKYVGTGWVTSGSITQRYSSNSPLIPGLLDNYRPLHMDIKISEPPGGLIWSGTLFSADIPMTVQWRLQPTSDLFADQATLLQADIFTASTAAQNYQVQSYIPHITIDQLRAASVEYPEDIKRRYLALPLEFPDRVRELVKRITAGITNPYDQATAIEQYLRETYPYDLKIPSPPSDQDVADYFLFDLKRGYCDYYATAMVVLARAAGLPARFVSGYASGEYDAPDAVYIIREKDAHSWAEVYFPEIGWIEFEPTASIPEITRDESLPTLSPADRTAESQSQFLLRILFFKTHWLYIPLIVILISPIVYFGWFEKRLYAKASPRSAIEKIYRQFYIHGRSVAGLQIHKETPLEFTSRLIEAINIRQVTSSKKLFNTTHQQAMIDLTDYYNLALFSKIEFTQTDFESIWLAWNKFRWRMIAAHFMASIKKQR